MLAIRETSRIEEHELDPLAGILISVVEAGASVGLLPPLSRDEARVYWLAAVTPDIRLVIAENECGIVGTAQLALATRANGSHRAEVGKVLVHPNAQRRGIGRALMQAVEPVARRSISTPARATAQTASTARLTTSRPARSPPTRGRETASCTQPSSITSTSPEITDRSPRAATRLLTRRSGRGGRITRRLRHH